jgi:hypothetical protein
MQRGLANAVLRVTCYLPATCMLPDTPSHTMNKLAFLLANGASCLNADCLTVVLHLLHPYAQRAAQPARGGLLRASSVLPCTTLRAKQGLATPPVVAAAAAPSHAQRALARENVPQLEVDASGLPLHAQPLRAYRCAFSLCFASMVSCPWFTFPVVACSNCHCAAGVWESVSWQHSRTRLKSRWARVGCRCTQCPQQSRSLIQCVLKSNLSLPNVTQSCSWCPLSQYTLSVYITSCFVI